MDITAGFYIRTTDEHTIRDNLRDMMYSDPESNLIKEWLEDGLLEGEVDISISDKGWEVLVEGITQWEKMIVSHLNQDFDGARDEGHDSENCRIGTLFIDTDEVSQMELLAKYYTGDSDTMPAEYFEEINFDQTDIRDFVYYLVDFDLGIHSLESCGKIVCLDLQPIE
jgi:hypothetical protein